MSVLLALYRSELLTSQYRSVTGSTLNWIWQIDIYGVGVGRGLTDLRPRKRLD